MTIGPGSRLGPYEVTALIGEGGMGKVWRAHHIGLKRDDALKVVPDAFASDPDRLARFQREAQVLASLNHPNIAHVHGLERSDGVQALVMELVEGPTLADRIAQGPIPVDEVLPIARQIAEALEAAHEQSIIHRDLKPANIKVRADGTVKVLDFGLAKALEPAAAMSASASMSPTITSPAMMTGVGVLLGTAAYMSPEQARGKTVDKRSDIWAFGCVLYEMLTGKRAFDGEHITDVLGAVVRMDPDWTALPVDVPPAVRTLLRRCLEKDRSKRISDIAAARFAIEEAGALGTAADAAVRPRDVAATATVRRRLLLVAGVALLVGGSIAAALVWLATRPASPRVVQLAIPTTSATALTISGNVPDVAITPDGSRVVYAGNNGTELFVRSLDALEPVSLFKGAITNPFVSPDSQWVGFVGPGGTAPSNRLLKVPVTGSPAVAIAERLDGNPRGITWSTDNSIVFATQRETTGLQQVSSNGGAPIVLTKPDRSRGEADHVWPEALPDGRSVLFTIIGTGGDAASAQIAVLDRATGVYTVVLRGGSHGHYVGSGYLIYAVGNTLRAIAFDPVTLQTRGTPISIIPDVVTTTGAPPGALDAAISAEGTLAYVRGGGESVGRRSLVWVDRQGRETPLNAPPRGYIYPRISADGRRVVVYASEQERDLWAWDETRLTLTRLTFAPGADIHAVWATDGQGLFFGSERDGERNIFRQAADGSGAVERLTHSPNTQNPSSVSPDGARLFFTEGTPDSGEDVMQARIASDNSVTPLIRSSFDERNAVVSPDGRWIAYDANDSGQFEIYVRPYPDVNSGRWQVSAGGGMQPLWSRDSQELFYVSAAGAIMRVGVQRDKSWSSTAPTIAVKQGYVTITIGNSGRSYDISPDGQRFLMLKAANDPNASAPQIVVVQHFDEELKRLVPTN